MLQLLPRRQSRSHIHHHLWQQQTKQQWQQQKKREQAIGFLQTKTSISQREKACRQSSWQAKGRQCIHGLGVGFETAPQRAAEKGLCGGCRCSKESQGLWTGSMGQFHPRTEVSVHFDQGWHCADQRIRSVCGKEDWRHIFVDRCAHSQIRHRHQEL